MITEIGRGFFLIFIDKIAKTCFYYGMKKNNQKIQDGKNKILKYSIALALFLVAISVYSYIDVLHLLARSNSTDPSVQGASSKNKSVEDLRKNYLRCRPQLSKPANRAVADSTSMLTWSVDCPTEVVSYQLRVTGAGIQPIMVNDIVETSYAVSNLTGLKEGKRYVWTVGTCIKRKNTKPTTTPVAESKKDRCDGIKWAQPRLFYWMKKPVMPSGAPKPTEILVTLPDTVTEAP